MPGGETISNETIYDMLPYPPSGKSVEQKVLICTSDLFYLRRQLIKDVQNR